MIIRADARHIPLRDESVQTVCTSPPYYALRDYGVAGQIGLEPSLQEYVATMVCVFREVWRVLRKDGVCWLNLGDSFAGHNLPGWREGDEVKNGGVSNKNGVGYVPGLKPKDLCGIPWRVAFALQANGWYLRSDIIWAKANPMPESVTDRPTRSHEYLFLLSKSATYYYDADAIREPNNDSSLGRAGHIRHLSAKELESRTMGGNGRNPTNETFYGTGGRNKRDVWTIPSESNSESHFAIFPQALVMPCILAGSRKNDLVFDPFFGSGTVGMVAERLGRRWAGLELSESYIEIAKNRTAQQGLFVGQGATRGEHGSL